MLETSVDCCMFYLFYMSFNVAVLLYISTMRGQNIFFTENMVILLPWFVRLYKDIIHELWQVDYLPYRRTNYSLTI